MSDEYKKYLRGRSLRQQRNAKNRTAEQLAEQVTHRTAGRPVTQAMIYAIEHGRMLLTPDLAARCADVLGISPQLLLDESSSQFALTASDRSQFEAWQIEPSAFQKGMVFARAEVLVHDASQVHRDLKALETELGLEVEPIGKKDEFIAQFDKVVLGLRRIMDLQLIRRGDVLSKELVLLEQEIPGTLEVVSSVRREVLQRYGKNSESNEALMSSFENAQRTLEVVANVLLYSIRASEQSLAEFQAQCGAKVDFSVEPTFELPVASRGDMLRMLEELSRLAGELEEGKTSHDLNIDRVGNIAWSACALSQSIFFEVCSLNAHDSKSYREQVITTMARFVDLLDNELASSGIDGGHAVYKMKVASSHIKVRLRSISEIIGVSSSTDQRPATAPFTPTAETPS